MGSVLVTVGKLLAVGFRLISASMHNPFGINTEVIMLFVASVGA
jgi:hypothetical protein